MCNHTIRVLCMVSVHYSPTCCAHEYCLLGGLSLQLEGPGVLLPEEDEDEPPDGVLGAGTALPFLGTQ